MMTARTDELDVLPIRWLLVPVAGFAAVVAALEALRRRPRTPRLTSMSPQWLREHAADHDHSTYDV